MNDRRGFLKRIGVAASASFAEPAGRLSLAWAGGSYPAVDVRGPVLGPLLARNRENFPGAGKGANHASMALLSMAALGGSAQQIGALGQVMLRNKRPFPGGGSTLNPQRWHGLLGDMDALPAFRRFFSGQIAAQGMAPTLRRYLPQLVPGLATAEFHCMIRTAFGVRFGDPDEVAMGLAYWSAAFSTLGPLQAASADPQPLHALSAIRTRLGAAASHVPGGSKGEQLQWAATLPGFASAASSLRIEPQSLAAMARTALSLYLGGGDFHHAVTGTHAYRTLEPFVGDREAGRRYLWQALAAYYLSEGAPPVVTAEPRAALPSWDEVLDRVRSRTDDHGLKMTHTAREESAHDGDGRRYLQAAAMAAKLI